MSYTPQYRQVANRGSAHSYDSYRTPHGSPGGSPFGTPIKERPSPMEETERLYGYRPQAAEKPSRRKWWILGGILLLLAIVGGVVGGILGTRGSSSSSGGSSANAGAGAVSTRTSAGATAAASPTATATGTNPNDPSNFALDPRLHKSLYAIAYSTPNGAMYPTCGDTIETIIPQVQLMSQVTKRIRLYGMDCDQGALVLQAINLTKTDLKVWLGVYMDTDPAIYERQVTTLLSVLGTYGTSAVMGVAVGNEAQLITVSAGGSQLTARATVLANVADTRARLRAAGYNIPVGSGDAGSMITAEYAAGLDFLFSNNHPFFAGTTITDSPGWAYQYLETDTPSVALRSMPTGTVIQGEIGWPSDALAGGALTLNGSAASIPNMQSMMDNYICEANANVTSQNLPYVWFQAFDSRYNLRYRGSEPFWGLWTWDNEYKPVTMPTCIAP